MSKREPDSSATGHSAAKRRRLNALLQKTASSKGPSAAVPSQQRPERDQITIASLLQPRWFASLCACMQVSERCHLQLLTGPSRHVSWIEEHNSPFILRGFTMQEGKKAMRRSRQPPRMNAYCIAPYRERRCAPSCRDSWPR